MAILRPLFLYALKKEITDDPVKFGYADMTDQEIADMMNGSARTTILFNPPIDVTKQDITDCRGIKL